MLQRLWLPLPLRFVAHLSDGISERFDLFQVICPHTDIASFLVHCQIDLLGIGVGGIQLMWNSFR